MASLSSLIQTRRLSANMECCIHTAAKTEKTSRGLLNFLWTAAE